MVRDEDWRRTDRELQRLLLLPAIEREAALAEIAAHDTGLAARLRILLANLHATDALDSIAGAPLRAQALSSVSGLKAGDRLGAWTLLRPIGSGGMAEVFEAERSVNEARQRAAIKIMALGLGSADLRARFQRETAILAQLDNARLSRLIDAGTALDGRPWLAMEFIDGERLDRACDRLALNLESRVRLVIEVCQAVDHAHRQLVIHRDLKPSNILLTPERAVRVLDFGIARVLDDGSDAEATQTGNRAYTMRYASPEQLQNASTGVASDVYQLGLVLYKLLTDRLPWSGPDRNPLQRLRQMTAGPMRPSLRIGAVPEAVVRARSTSRRRLQRQLHGDLDSIVMHALELRPESRYPGARELGDDLQRWLDRQPITARRYSATYRASRYLRRHWIGASALAVIVLLGIGYAVQTTWQAARLAEERNQAELARQRAESMQAFLLGVIGSADPYLRESRGKSVDQLLIDGVERAQASFADQPLLAAQVMADMGDVLLRRGRFADATGAFQAALDFRESELGPAHPVTLSTLRPLGYALFGEGRLGEALATLTRNLEAIQRQGVGPSEELVEALKALGSVESVHGDIAVAEQRLRAAIDMHRSLHAELTGDAALAAASLDNQLAVILIRDQRFAEAEPLLAASYAANAEILGALDQRTHVARKNWANVLRMLKRADAAERELLALLDDERQLYQGPHWQIAYTLGHLGNLASDRADYAEAIRLWQQAETEARAAVGDDYPFVFLAQMAAARSMLRGGRRDEGRAILQRIAAMDSFEDDTAARAAEELRRDEAD